MIQKIFRKIFAIKLYQFAHGFYYGDGLGNLGVALDKKYLELGYNTGMYCLDYDKNFYNKIKNICDFKNDLKKNNIAILHYTMDSPVNEFVSSLNCRKWFYYHNVTPADFFRNFNNNIAENCKSARLKLESYKEKFEKVLTPSEFNAEELRKIGFKNIIVEPLIKDYSMLDETPDEKIMEKFKDGYFNIIFVGRVVPNKNYEFLLEIFRKVKEKYQKCRLLLPGHIEDSYYGYLLEIIKKNNINDVIFFNRIPQNQLNALYKVSHLFLCVSRHEGFCMPLIEAKYFNIPVIALDKGAVKQTIGDYALKILETEDADLFVEVILKKWGRF